jgi:hypothetical protein
MNPQVRQERLLKIQSSFDKMKFIATGKPGEEVSFEFNYKGDIPVDYYVRGCSCTNAKADFNDDQTEVKISGVVKLEDIGSGVYEKYLADTNPNKKPFIKLVNLSVYFDNSEDMFQVVNLERVNNPNKIGFALEIEITVNI